ncbi:N-acetyltransferase [Actinobacteria bacterium YIM 96077]|uniref:N-acetyltransferase n=1 Tax=Phytoactinopolyspora halophila TaxID=1981511 RepID=A0A329R6N7_9ACTN|nr:GNAT family N-acetyltransferase [Phytoactinopolyspora halophila]AYY12068.1 N-acetyltransferase [Actinobacteria bacterium YIM 96077]RAW18698.1 N-acetyltransferase [Phytoactinopolyspora halophila]
MEPFDLTSERVRLSAPSESDIDQLATLCQDPEITRWTTVPSPYTRQHAEDFVRQQRDGWASGRSLTWAIRDPADARVIGMIGVGLTGDGLGDIGFWLAPDARGRGLCSHAVRLVADRVFSDAALGVTHLTWWAYVGNWASRRVAWSTGFRHEGYVRGGAAQRGARRDAWVATLCAGDPMVPASRWLDVPVLRGSRVVLRPYEETDADALAEACRDPETLRWLNSLPRPYTRDDAVQFIHRAAEEAASGHAVTWAAASPDDGRAIGSFSIRLPQPRRDQGELGYLVHPAARGSGVASEAARLMVRHAFISADDGGLGLRRLVIEHAEGNEGSRKVIERIGFRHCGTERATFELSDGTFAAQYRYDLLPEEFA